MSAWKRGDVVLDDTGNMFVFHNLHGWYGLESNQCSSRGRHEPWELHEPLTLLVRDRRPVSPPVDIWAWGAVESGPPPTGSNDGVIGRHAPSSCG